MHGVRNGHRKKKEKKSEKAEPNRKHKVTDYGIMYMNVSICMRIWDKAPAQNQIRFRQKKKKKKNVAFAFNGNN